MLIPLVSGMTASLLSAGLGAAAGKQQIPALCHWWFTRGCTPDIGGGYPPGDRESRMVKMISIIAVADFPFESHDIYRCFRRGAPLKITTGYAAEFLKMMLEMIPWNLLDAFFVDEALVQPLQCLANSPQGQTCPKTFDRSRPLTTNHLPPAARSETVIAEQMAWITAWRIDRYARLDAEKRPSISAPRIPTRCLPRAEGGRRDS